MINMCKQLRVRQKNYKKYFYCCKTKTITYIDECKKCLEFEPRVNKPIKKVSNKRIIVSKETYNKVFKRDEGKCRLCGTSLNLHLHHIMRERKRFNK